MEVIAQTRTNGAVPGISLGTPARGGNRLSVYSVPPAALAAAAERVADLGLPVRQSTVILAGIASLIGLDRERLITFVTHHSTPGRKTTEPLDWDALLAERGQLRAQAMTGEAVAP
jgi:hypothetical protein